MKSGVCGSVSIFDIAGTGAVYIEVARGTLCFPPPMLGLTIRVEGGVLQAEIRKAVKRSVVAVVKF